VILSGCVWGTKIGARTEKSTVCRRDADFGTPHDQDSYFSHHYHTTLVSVIAACLRSRRLKERAPQPPRATTSVREAPPRLERRLDAARAAGSWLGRLTDDVLSEAGPQAGLLSQLLLGIWAAAALAGAGLNTVATEVRRIGRRLAERDALNDLSWADTSATQSLLVARVLEHYEIVVPYLHASDGFVARAVQTLEVTDDPALNEPRIVLQNAGRLPESPCPGAGEVVAHAEGLRLGADPEEIDALVDRVEAHTAFATRPSQLRPRDGWTAEVLAGVAVYCLRRYDFIRGTRLIRALRALEPLNPTSLDLLHHCLNFIYFNQRPDGAFGFLAPEAHGLEAAEPDRDAERALALPVTVNCLWALAEAETAWRLFSTLET
jgi:hypothetical protein